MMNKKVIITLLSGSRSLENSFANVVLSPFKVTLTDKDFVVAYKQKVLARVQYPAEIFVFKQTKQAMKPTTFEVPIPENIVRCFKPEFVRPIKNKNTF